MDGNGSGVDCDRQTDSRTGKEIALVYDIVHHSIGECHHTADRQGKHTVAADVWIMRCGI